MIRREIEAFDDIVCRDHELRGKRARTAALALQFPKDEIRGRRDAVLWRGAAIGRYTRDSALAWPLWHNGPRVVRIGGWAGPAAPVTGARLPPMRPDEPRCALQALGLALVRFWQDSRFASRSVLPCLPSQRSASANDPVDPRSWHRPRWLRGIVGQEPWRCLIPGSQSAAFGPCFAGGSLRHQPCRRHRASRDPCFVKSPASFSFFSLLRLLNRHRHR